MNENHARLCPSPEWAEHLHTDVLPVVTDGVDLGDEMLEIGPGPGASTEWLRHRVQHLVAVEHDEDACTRLSERMAGMNVRVVHADATSLPLEADTFDSAASFTMLHHVPTPELQDALFAEVARVLRSDGVFVAADSLASDGLAEFHEGDTYNPIDPTTLEARLRRAGFADVSITVADSLMFVARPRRVNSLPAE
ncbi:MAG: class I SAM-dependent methyltransferase [Acidimicrobiia bacterium]|nr:class I SAM-dependent methyltransferase [Acidimicrobiia bacterium]